MVPRNNGLNTVLIFFKNPNLGNTDRLIFSLSLPGGAELRHIEISGRNIGDGETVRFQFPPVPDSAGITYLLTISTPDTSPGTPYPLSVAFSSVDAYLPGRVISPAGMTGDLSFQLFYAPVSRGELVADLWHLFLPRVLSLHLFLTTAFVLIFGFRFLRFCISRIPEDR
ncbi:TPA: hypothetical protein DCZ90_03485 [Candidatus Amesbacteria bacterium]|nr:hypothetical protein [Candidatus Amesbacteria bacterium]